MDEISCKELIKQNTIAFVINNFLAKMLKGLVAQAKKQFLGTEIASDIGFVLVEAQKGSYPLTTAL